MGHHITAVVGTALLIERVAAAAAAPPLTNLQSGLVIAPLGEHQIDAITALQPGSYAEGFAYLSEALQSFLSSASLDGALAYIETGYFGGTGSQAAAVFSGGEMILKSTTSNTRDPIHSDDPINAALRTMGIKAVDGRDEFDTVGLGRFRSMESLGLDED
jgi:hypothetical protein